MISMSDIGACFVATLFFHSLLTRSMGQTTQGRTTQTRVTQTRPTDSGQKTTESLLTARDRLFNDKQADKFDKCMKTGEDKIQGYITELVQSFKGQYRPSFVGITEKRLLDRLAQSCKSKEHAAVQEFVRRLELEHQQQVGIREGEEKALKFVAQQKIHNQLAKMNPDPGQSSWKG